MSKFRPYFFVFIVCFTVADATPIRVRTSALTNTFAVVSWNLPSTAMGEGIVLSNYTATVELIGIDTSYSAGVPSQAFLLDESINTKFPGGVTPGRPVIVTFTANYASPPVSDATSTSFRFKILRNVNDGKGSSDREREVPSWPTGAISPMK